MNQKKYMQAELEQPVSKTNYKCGQEFPPANQWRTQEGVNYALMENIEELDPFFLNIVGTSNHWLFCGSNGALSAGRCSPETALFPYYTVDKILENWNTTGPWTTIVTDGKIWNPFNPSLSIDYKPERNLLKSELGDEIVFEETNSALGLRYTYRWQFSEKFGFIRRVKIQNIADTPSHLRLVDGLDNLMPAGVDNRTQNELSCLTHAYKVSELEANGKLLIHRLASSITDEAIPLECLLATTVWTSNIDDGTTYLNRKSAEKYLLGDDAKGPTSVRAERGAFFIAREFSLKPGESKEWMMAAEINQSQSKISHLLNQLKDPKLLEREVLADISAGSDRLRSIVASADGIQQTEDKDSSLYHYQNTLSNILRGGIPADGYLFKRNQFISYLKKNNRPLAEEHRNWLDSLPEQLLREELIKEASHLGNADMLRLAEEYLPLILSRRHGDPSRPWNKFAIKLKNDAGEPLLHFEGNWRDIFQNWEALAISYPGFLGSFISKFLNASTVDGFNPYRITSEGVDWEVPDPNDPWASIGYWGDHQIIYLLKFLELQANVNPTKLAELIDRQQYVFADVPYRLAGWERTLADPRETIDFDMDHHQKLMALKETIGGDALLKSAADGTTVKVTLAEKLLLPAIVKIANLIPGGGIWMNTQRPEWNDANNALAGYGLSMVTAGYLYRYLEFIEKLIKNHQSEFHLSAPFAQLVETITDLLADPRWTDTEQLSGSERYQLVSTAGKALEKHRARAYSEEFGKPITLNKQTILDLLERSKQALQQTLKHNIRKDGLYHSYNILRIDRANKTMTVKNLSVMLEGQVSILSSGMLKPQEAVTLLKTLPKSTLVSERHKTYLLYPDRTPESFIDKNQISEAQVLAIPTLALMAQKKDSRIITSDPICDYRFHSSIRNSYELASKLDVLQNEPDLADQLSNDRAKIAALYESTFDHQSFTGRSGSMFGYEGLGCIYWHMVSKLMLAVQETVINAANSGVKNEVFQELVQSYFSVQSGLGFRKSASDYGAFPAEAYSHSPAHAGAQQPGLTGQVKEGVLCRFGELGVKYVNGQLSLRPLLLREAEFTVDSSHSNIPIAPNTVSFTIAGVPVTYLNCADISESTAEVTLDDHSKVRFKNSLINEALTTQITQRTGKVREIKVNIPSSSLLSS